MPSNLRSLGERTDTATDTPAGALPSIETGSSAFPFSNDERYLEAEYPQPNAPWTPEPELRDPRKYLAWGKKHYGDAWYQYREAMYHEDDPVKRYPLGVEVMRIEVEKEAGWKAQGHEPRTPEPGGTREYVVWGRKHYGDDWHKQWEAMYHEPRIQKYMGLQQAVRVMERQKEASQEYLSSLHNTAHLAWGRKNYGAEWMAIQASLNREQNDDERQKLIAARKEIERQKEAERKAERKAKRRAERKANPDTVSETDSDSEPEDDARIPAPGGIEARLHWLRIHEGGVWLRRFSRRSQREDDERKWINDRELAEIRSLKETDPWVHEHRMIEYNHRIHTLREHRTTTTVQTEQETKTSDMYGNVSRPREPRPAVISKSVDASTSTEPSQPHASASTPQDLARGSFRKTNSGRISKNARLSQSPASRGTRSRQSAQAEAGAQVPARLSKILAHYSNNTQVPPMPGKKQPKEYQRGRESRRLAGRAPEYGMLPKKGEAAPQYEASANTRKSNRSGTRGGSVPKEKPVAAKGSKPQGVSKSGKETRRGKRSKRQ